MNLSELTTLRVGGPVSELIEAPLAEVVPTVTGPLLVLGGGSNILAADDGFAGVVVRDSAHEITDLGGGALRVDAGTNWDALVAMTVDMGLTGLEALSGIPGSVGAAPVQNIGAYGAEVGEVLASVRVWDRQEHAEQVLTANDLQLGYRDSLLKRSIRSGEWGPTGRWVVLSVDIELERGAGAPVRYKELAGLLGVPIGGRASAKEVRQAVLQLRGRKGMLLDPADHDTWSAGSFFTNPIVDVVPEGAPAFPAGTGFKTSAAWLIERSGFAKGFSLNGRAALSTKHVLALTNRGGANADDILELARTVQKGVREKFNIELQPEPVLVGCAL